MRPQWCSRLLVACLFWLGAASGASAAPDVTRMWFTPAVVPDTYTQPVRFEATITGGPSTVAFEYNGIDRAMFDDGTHGDRTAGDGTWTIEFAASEIVGKLTAAWVYRPFIGYCKPAGGGKFNVFAEVWTSSIGLAGVQPLDATTQRTDYVVNFVVSATDLGSTDYTSVAKRFYGSYGDTFDFLNIVHVGGGPRTNRFHVGVKNDELGLGIAAFNSTSSYGSSGRLKGLNAFPISSLFDTVSNGFNHETGHQWINFLQNTPFASGIPHWPKGNIAINVMGSSIPGSNVGGSYSWIFTPNGLGGYNVAFNQAPNANTSTFNSMELYLMGLVPPSEVGSFFVLKDQNQDVVNGQVLQPSEITPVTVADVVAVVGPRVPDSASSQKSFRVATILISEQLLDVYAMSLYDWFARRAEQTTTQSCAEGFSTYTCKPFFVATGGRATMASRIGEGCGFPLSPAAAVVGQAGAVGNVAVAPTAGTCSWTAASSVSWITVLGGSSGTGNGTVTYSVVANSAFNQRTGTLTIAGRPFTITQAGTGPTMSVDRTGLQFAATSNGAAFVQQTGTQTVRLLQSGSGTVTWTATPSQPWITVTPTSGTGAATLTIGVQFTSAVAVAGTSSGTVTLAFTGAGNTAGPISVGLTTVANGTSTAPFGSFDTPTDNATGVAGSIAVTGWVLDDLGVSKVEIWRDPVAGEGSAQIFIGTAVLVDGARPDVAATYPTKPRNTQAGWGYLMLTNFLPSQGNGTFRIAAIATDVEGKTTTLGTKTITCANSTAVKPFGAIDTPGQGEVVSGTNYANFGWVLAREPARADPPDGGTVTAFIDGTAIGAPGGWVARSDLTTFFPPATYPAVVRALGVIGFNTTTLANGVHTIFWIVTATNGQTDGIGSRFFTVANSGVVAGVGGSGARGFGSSALGQRDAAIGSSVRLDAPALLVPAGVSTVALREAVHAAPPSLGAIAARRGFDLTAPFRSFSVGANGRTTILGEELDRFEVQLGASGYAGYMRVGDDLGPLPIGSHLDEPTGVFTWAPGVGFVHDYDLVFVRWSQGRAVSRQDVRFVLQPKQSNRVGPQVVIDLPAPPATVVTPFLIGGWAVDLEETIGTGVDTLHVWAYPTSACGPREESGVPNAAAALGCGCESSSAAARASGGGAPRASNKCGDPIFLGATAYGGARPDVAAVFGDRFKNSGYGLIVDSLPPGTYDLAVFAWSTVQHGFVPAKAVHLTVR